MGRLGVGVLETGLCDVRVLGVRGGLRNGFVLGGSMSEARGVANRPKVVWVGVGLSR